MDDKCVTIPDEYVNTGPNQQSFGPDEGLICDLDHNMTCQFWSMGMANLTFPGLTDLHGVNPASDLDDWEGIRAYRCRKL